MTNADTVVTSQGVHADDEVPPLSTVIEAIDVFDDRVDLQTPLPGRLPSQFDAHVGDVEACDLPPLRGQEEGVPALPHADVERAAGRPTLDRFGQERIVWEVAARSVGVELVPGASRGCLCVSVDGSGQARRKHDDGGSAHHVGSCSAQGTRKTGDVGSHSIT